MKHALHFFQLVFFSVSAFGQTEFKVLQEKFDAYRSKDLFNGIIVIAKNEKTVFSEKSGYASFEEQIKLDDNTPMPISSITKSFTAMSIMILVEKQQLQLDDPVKKYLIHFPYDDISIRHLLNNTAGFKRIYREDLLSTEEVVTFVYDKKPKLSFVPGKQYQYSNLGYSLLAAVVEEVSDKSFSMFLEDEIFKKLNMSNTFMLNPGSHNRFKADSHNKKNKTEKLYLDSYPGAIGIYASANDLLKWDRALYSDILVSQELINSSFQGGKLNDGTTINYGFGWRKWKGMGNLIFHGGEWVGNESILFRDIENKLTIIILANRENKLRKWQLMDEILSELDYGN